ncbi:DUF871 domain-containing protein [Acidaminobacter sp. JC074]|uniref:DUF871 domain-containing protein n=1 Tax=Acidaminobacter sp. JC074 TaxID=2530199 RepID=UPI001F0FA346|nr:MupG family TIM beta-alpha barrel fold protein [Acidaminobacter sp. JC074]MCH4887239.1 DUF871 domain-containing protein [Acidaminobacter sp. JC074]
MRGLGISIYPEHGSLQEIIDYIQLASKYGFTRIFTCFISIKDEDFEKFKCIMVEAGKCNMKVIADISPEVFEKMQASVHDLKPFVDLGLSGIRLDIGFTGNEESIMTANPYGLKIEINMSNGTKYLETIMSYQPVKENLYGCHNFYPHRYTGLSNEHFMKCSQQFSDLGIHTAGFVSSEHARFGPWPVEEGLCTLESHRDLDIVTQAKDLFSSGLIDDVIIGNAFASESELKLLSELTKEMIEFRVSLEENITELEKTIVLEEPHFNRGDVSAYMIRSTQSRVKYRGEYFEPKNIRDIKKGDILIDSSLYARYAGELQIALKDMKNSGKTSIVGKISDDEIYLLDRVKPWQKFKLIKSEV